MTTVTIEEVVRARRELEDRLTVAVQRELKEFRRQTGNAVGVRSVDVNVARVDRVSDPRPISLVSSVSVRLDL